MKTIISGFCSFTRGNRISKINGGYILDGDIELNEDGKELYIESSCDGERSCLVENMPEEVQEYIKQNKFSQEDKTNER